jgi:hypothetical protein
VHGRYFRNANANANANSIIIKMFTTRLIIGHTGRQTMGIESHQETSGVLLSEKCVKELHFVSFSCWSSYFRNEPSKFLLTNLCDMNVFCRSLTSNRGLTGPIPAEISNLGFLEIL